MWYPGVKIQCRWCFGYHKKETKCEKKISFADYLVEFKTTNPELQSNMFTLKENKDDEDKENENTDIYSFLDDLEEEVEEDKQEIEIDNNNNNKNYNIVVECEETLTVDQVKEWTLQELEVYLLSFTPTEEETTWLKEAAKDKNCLTESDAMPFFKAIIMKRLNLK